MAIKSEDSIPSLPIRIDKDGVWYYRGDEMFRKDILALFFESLKRNEQGEYLIEFRGEKCLIDVEDTPFVVKGVIRHSHQDRENEYLELFLNDFTKEKLDPSTLRVGMDNVLYCSIKEGAFEARFSRPGYYQIAECIEYDTDKDAYFVCLNEHIYYIETYISGGTQC